MVLKRNRKQILNMFVLILLFTVLFSSLVFFINNEKIALNTSIGLVIEDDAMEVKLLISSIRSDQLNDIITFEETTLDKGKRALESGDLLALIHVEGDTFKNLDSGKKTTLNMYVLDEEDIRVSFLSRYIKNMIEMLNSSQNSAMIYFDLQKSQGVSFEKRIESLNELSIKYIQGFLLRQSIYEKGDTINNFLGQEAIDYYFHVLLIGLMIIAAMVFHHPIDLDLKEGRIRRLKNVGYALKEIYISKGVIGFIYIGGLVITIKLFYMSISDTLSILKVLEFTMKFMFLAGVIQWIVIVLYQGMKETFKRDIVTIFIFFVFSLLAGFIYPIDVLPEFIQKTKNFNILYYGLYDFVNQGFHLSTIVGYLAYYFLLMQISKQVIRYE